MQLLLQKAAGLTQADGGSELESPAFRQTPQERLTFTIFSRAPEHWEIGNQSGENILVYAGQLSLPFHLNTGFLQI